MIIIFLHIYKLINNLINNKIIIGDNNCKIYEAYNNVLCFNIYKENIKISNKVIKK